ncbi:MAG: DEAD/DEAH box helicase [Thermoanaerobaculia bacterium]
MTTRPLLADRLPKGGPLSPDDLLDRFVGWAADAGFQLYPHQEEALLEVYSGKHVILNTPTGSGKSMVALGLHFKALAEGRISFYTSPIKALASEKFFALCDDFGAEHVGMLTGDASINPEAKILCCTSEVLANMALRSGDRLEAPYAVLDEFHYYSDHERGWAWQVPLITLPRTRFLLMSATLGDMSGIADKLERATSVRVASVTAATRPVPLEFEYRETPLHETIEELLEKQRFPVYVVNFTQRECAELAQALTSLGMTTREEREAIRAEIGDFRFDTPYGKEIRRFLTFGVGIHHAGLLPKYRLLVEQLSQKGMLKLICGTDTLGVGVNIPIRTVLFTKLSKYDGEKVQILAVRDFQQIAGRAGRKGFDDKGWVVAQAPEQVIEKRQAEKKGKKGKKGGARGPAARGGGRPTAPRSPIRGPARAEVLWTKETFEKLISRPPETLRSRFKISHGMVLNLLQRDEEIDDPTRRNFASLRELIAGCHEDDGAKKRHLRFASVLVRSLHRAGIVVMKRDSRTNYRWVIVSPDLQFDFSLYHALSLFLVEMVPLLDPGQPDYVGDLLSTVEAVLEDPGIILRKQADRAKGAAIAEMKAERIQYEERMEKLEGIEHPKPLADWLNVNFDRFARMHPWVGGKEISPKSIGREMWETFSSFGDYVKSYGLERSEGVVLRYLSQLYRTLQQNVPISAKTEAVEDALGFFRTTIELTDTSLLEEWESLLHPELLVRRREEREKAVEAIWVRELVENPRSLAARVRSEMHLLVHDLARKAWEEAAERVVQPAGDAEGGDSWDARRMEKALEPFFEEHESLLDSPESRRHQWTQIRPIGDRQWEVQQTLLDPEEDNLWGIRARVDLRRATTVEMPLLRLVEIGK